MFSSLLLSAVVLGHTLVPSTFCQGIANNGMSYGQFIEAHALNVTDFQNLTPEVRESIRKERASRWADAVRKGQTHLCGKASF